MGHPEVPLEQTQEDLVHHAEGTHERWIIGVAMTAAILAVLAAVTALLAEHHANEDKLKEYQADQEKLKEQAERKQAASEAHLRQHAVFARGVTMFQVAIAVGSVSVLTRRKVFWLVCLGFGPVAMPRWCATSWATCN